MALTERLAILIDANGSGAIREFQKVGIAAERDLGRAESHALKMSSTMMKTGVGMVTGSALVARGMWNAAEGAAALEAQVKTTDATFGGASGTIDEFAKHSADSVGLSESAFRNWSSVLGSTLKNMGSTKQEAADMSVEFIKLGADLGIAFGRSPVDAIEAIGAAFRGEYDPIEKFGVSVKEADVQAKIVAMGLSTATRGAERHSKAIATMALIQEQTTAVQGRFGASGEDAVAKQAKMAAKLEDAKNQLGSGFLPVLSRVVDTLATGASAFKDFDTATGGAAATALGWTVVAIAGVGAASTLAGAVTKAAVNLGLKATAAEVAAAATAKATVADGANVTAAGAASTANMTLAGSFTAVAVGAALGLAAVMKINSMSGENQQEFFGEINFKDIEAANQKLNETGEVINGLSDRWNNYSAVQKLAGTKEWKQLEDLKQQQIEHRKHLDAEVTAVNAVGVALGISAKEAEKLATELKIDPSAFPIEKVTKALKDFKEGKSAKEVLLELSYGLDEANASAAPLAEQLTKLEKSTKALVDAGKAYESSQLRVVDAQDSVAQSGEKVIDAQRAQAQASEKIIDAQRAEVQSHERVKDAVRAVADAKERLAIIAQGGEGGEQYGNDIEQASINLRRAKMAEAEAEKKLLEAKTPDEQTKASLDLEQARLDLSRSNEALTRAVGAQNVDTAKATDDLQKAQDSLTQAQIDAEKAGQAVAQAQYDAGKAAQAVTAAQRDAGRAQRDLSAANYDAVNAMMTLQDRANEQKKSLLENADAVDRLKARYAELAALAPGYAAAIAPLMASTYMGSPIRQTTLDFPGASGARAMGGPVSAGGTYLIGERGPELLEMGGNGFITPNNMLGGSSERESMVSTPITINLDGRALWQGLVPHAVIDARGRR